MNNGYQQQSQLPRRGISEQEFRLRRLIADMQLPVRVDSVYCFICRSLHENKTPDSYPSFCSHCLHAFDEKGQYCLPDIVIVNGENMGVLFVNDHDTDKDKVRKKIKYQVNELKADGRKVFLIKNDEVDNSTNSGLKMRLYSMWRAVADDGLYKSFYAGEKEYSALR